MPQMKEMTVRATTAEGKLEEVQNSATAKESKLEEAIFEIRFVVAEVVSTTISLRNCLLFRLSTSTCQYVITSNLPPAGKKSRS